MRQYELTVLIHPDLEMNLQPALDKVKKIVDDAGGKITKEANEGKKRLAYKIAKQEFAVYYYFELDLPDDNKMAKKVASNLDIADEIIRYLLVKVDENRLKMEAKRKERKGAADTDSEESANNEEE
ncbi:30S ribosomal protein S6 [Candidatus Saccharibacteria bacterium]|nr:30S ribosomal protein S6 [Candidatus Saccharibacteria bacterium]